MCSQNKAIDLAISMSLDSDGERVYVCRSSYGGYEVVYESDWDENKENVFAIFEDGYRV